MGGNPASLKLSEGGRLLRSADWEDSAAEYGTVSCAVPVFFRSSFVHPLCPPPVHRLCTGGARRANIALGRRLGHMCATAKFTPNLAPNFAPATRHKKPREEERATAMYDTPEKKKSEFALIQLMPNMMTVGAICAGLSAIRFGFYGNYSLAVMMILLAAILDGLDGRLARALHSESKMGAELDSLADFLNFGVATPLVIYLWALQDAHGLGWISVLVFSVCCVVRLARFNVSTKSQETPKGRSGYFDGIPSPAGALLALLPMFVSFAFGGDMVLPELLICLHMVVIGLLMISHIQTWSPKAMKIPRENVKYLFVGFAFMAAALLTYAWTVLVVLCLAYVVMVIWGLVSKPKG